MLSGAGWRRVAWVGLLLNLGVAIGEETVFRGYLLTGLRPATGKWSALLAMTIIFGLFHLAAYVEDAMGLAPLTLAIFLASAFELLFGLVYPRTGSPWLPAALHFAWNYLENDLLNLTGDCANQNLVSGIKTIHLAPITVVLVCQGTSTDCFSTAATEPLVSAGFGALTPSRPGYGCIPCSIASTSETALCWRSLEAV